MKKIIENKYKIGLCLIILIAGFLRIWQLTVTPPALDWDEVSWGYNAYSMAETGRDEYGESLPITLRSLNDFKPALQLYVLTPVVKIFGLSDLTVRLPMAIFGILAIPVTYFLVLELFKRKDIALLTSFLLAISPWSIQFSRFTHEAILGLTLNLLMALFFVKGLKNPKLLMLSALCGGLSLYSYQNEKVFVPLFALVLLISFFKEFKKIPYRYIIFALILGFIVALPLAVHTITKPESLMRAKGASITKNPVGVLNMQFYPERNLINRENNDVLGLAFDNRRVVYAKDMIENYLLHFDPNFLFVEGEKIIRHQVSNMGHLYLFELPFILIGIYILIFGKFRKSVKTFIFLWILIVPIPAMITWDVPHSGRTLNFLPTFQILASLGIIYSIKYLFDLRINKLFKYLVSFVIFSAILFNILFYLNQYFVQYKYYSSHEWQYGYVELLSKLEKYYPNYDKIVVSNKKPLDQSYIFFLYHLKYPPARYQENSIGKYKSENKVDKYEFRSISWNNEGKGLYVGAPDDFRGENSPNILEEIKFINGDTAFLIVDVK